jgi:hypothetical protein
MPVDRRKPRRSSTHRAPRQFHETGTRRSSVNVSHRVILAFAVLSGSIAYGERAARPADPLAAQLSAELADAGIATDVRVFAVPFTHSQTLTSQVQRAMSWTPHVGKRSPGKGLSNFNVTPIGRSRVDTWPAETYDYSARRDGRLSHAMVTPGPADPSWSWRCTCRFVPLNWSTLVG